MIAAQPANHTAQSRPNQPKHKQTNKQITQKNYAQFSLSHNCTIIPPSPSSKKNKLFPRRCCVTLLLCVRVSFLYLSFDKSIQNGISICLGSLLGATVRALRTLLMFAVNLFTFLNTQQTTREFDAFSSKVDAGNRCA